MIMFLSLVFRDCCFNLILDGPSSNQGDFLRLSEARRKSCLSVGVSLPSMYTEQGRVCWGLLRF